MEYIKHFNQQSENYLCYRPDYPPQLFNFLATLVDASSCVWDCGTGNGQAALALAKRFKQVIATDINLAPLTLAPRQDNIHYLCCLAEQPPLRAHTVELVTVAQALHWFDFPRFYTEVIRIAKAFATIAAWSYSLCSVNKEIDGVIARLYCEILGEVYWPKERHYIDEQYKTIPFPFKKIKSPSFMIEKKLNFNSFVGYLNTWSAIKEYQKSLQQNPINLVIDDLQAVWGATDSEYMVRWPLHLLIGHIT